jgi:(R,R)-butanediol dehydrogenase/meso-butanediol dehydrogenase/diacetyl reductase
MGHEMCGTVIEVGKEVSGVSVGQRVTVNPAMDDRHHGTAQCKACLSGRHNICNRVAFYGLNANGGGFSDEISVKPLALVPLPANVPLKLAGLAEPLAVAAHMIRISGFRKGDSAVVLGAGPIGCALTFLLKHKGARKILVSEIAASRAKQAASFGADRVVNPQAAAGSPTPVIAAVHELIDEDGADISYDACGIQATLDTAIACTRPGGVVFNVAIHERPLSLQLNSISLSEKKLTGRICYTKADFEEVVQILSERGDEAEKLITSVVPLANVIDGGFKELIENTANHVKILIEVNGEEM